MVTETDTEFTDKDIDNINHGQTNHVMNKLYPDYTEEQMEEELMLKEMNQQMHKKQHENMKWRRNCMNVHKLNSEKFNRNASFTKSQARSMKSMKRFKG